jgi:periplasmic protein CpxP/Spy
MNMTKHTLMALVAVAATLTLQPPAQAGDASQSASPAAGDRAAVLRERMQETARELNLTPEQQQKLQAIVRDHMGKLRELRQDTSLSPEEKRQKLAAAREEIVAEVKKVLTPDQFEKWQARQGTAAGAAAGPLARMHAAINDLNLTDQQKEQLKPLYQEQMAKLNELRQDTSLSMAEKLDKLRAMHLEAAPKLKKVLNAVQYAQWEKDVNEWLDQLKQRLQGQKQN